MILTTQTVREFLMICIFSQVKIDKKKKKETIVMIMKN